MEVARHWNQPRSAACQTRAKTRCSWAFRGNQSQVLLFPSSEFAAVNLLGPILWGWAGSGAVFPDNLVLGLMLPTFSLPRLTNNEQLFAA